MLLRNTLRKIKSRFSLFLVVLIAILISSGQSYLAEGNFLTISDTDSTQFEYKGQLVKLNGVNVNNLNALGIWQASNINRIEVGPGDYEKISQLGANHVRFGMSYQWYLNNPANFYNNIDNHVQWAHENNLWLVPTMFTLPYLNENTNDGSAHVNGGCYQGYSNPCNFWGTSVEAIAAREAFKNFWIEFVDRYKDEEAIAGYDLINEPWTNDETYNRGVTLINYYTDIITAIVNGGYNSNQLFFLESEPEPLSWVLYDSYSTGVSKLNNLKTITNNRIVLSSHMYEPYTLTHYTRATYPTDEDGVTWSNATMSDPTAPDAHPGSIIQELRSGQTITVNGTSYNSFSDYLIDYPHDIKNRFAVSFANEDLDIPFYIGEWSAQQTEAEDGTGWHTTTFLDYNSDVANLFDDWGVHNAVFEFKAGSKNWGLFSETGAKSYGAFNEAVSSNSDNPAETTQPFIDTLSSIWNSEVKPDFVTFVPAVCQNGIVEGSEVCDDGNGVNGDGCSSLCKIERKGPTISGTRNICSVQATLSDFRFDGSHRISTGSYTNPASIPADSGYPSNNQALRLGNDGSNYHIPYVWFESVNLPKNASLTNAYIDFNTTTVTASSAFNATIYGFKVGGNLRTYDPDGGSASRYFVDRAPYSTYLGGANWVNWRSYAAGSAITPFVGFPHDALLRSNGAVYQWSRTTSNSVWSLPSENIQSDQYYPSSNIASVVNELTTEAGWNPGNDLGFILVPGLGNSSAIRSFYGYDASISTSLNNYTYTPTNNDINRIPKFYANCVSYVSGLSAAPDNLEVRENNALNGNVATDNLNGADLNPGSYTLSYGLIKNVENGSLEFNNIDGTFVYTPNLNYSGNDNFRYVVTDNNGGTSDATVSIQIIGNIYPYLMPQIILEGDSLNPFTIKANTSDSDGTISSIVWSKVSGPGEVFFEDSTLDETSVSFLQTGNYVLQVSVTDNEGGESIQTLNINIPEIPPDPDPDPVSYPESYPVSYPPEPEPDPASYPVSYPESEEPNPEVPGGSGSGTNSPTGPGIQSINTNSFNISTTVAVSSIDGNVVIASYPISFVVKDNQFEDGVDSTDQSEDQSDSSSNNSTVIIAAAVCVTGVGLFALRRKFLQIG